jgi:hypothetical protein
MRMQGAGQSRARIFLGGHPPEQLFLSDQAKTTIQIPKLLPLYLASSTRVSTTGNRLPISAGRKYVTYMPPNFYSNELSARA